MRATRSLPAGAAISISADLKAYLARFPWYAPNSWNPKLNAIEEANVALIDQTGKR